MQEMRMFSRCRQGADQPTRILDIARDNQYRSPTTNRLSGGMHKTPDPRVTNPLYQQGNEGVSRQRFLHGSRPRGRFDRRRDVERQPCRRSLSHTVSRVLLGTGGAMQNDILPTKDQSFANQRPQRWDHRGLAVTFKGGCRDALGATREPLQHLRLDLSYSPDGRAIGQTLLRQQVSWLDLAGLMNRG